MEETERAASQREAERSEVPELRRECVQKRAVLIRRPHRIVSSRVEKHRVAHIGSLTFR